VAHSLSDRDKAILDLEGRGWRTAGLKEGVIRRELGLTPVAYYQVLNALLDSEAAVAYSPMAVSRLKRLRER
jgi:hypothetical protein